MSLTLHHLDYSMLTPLLYPNQTQSPNICTSSTISSPTSSPYAFIVLNRPFEQDEFERLWLSATIRIIVDGSLNRLFTITQHNKIIKHSQLPQYENIESTSVDDLLQRLENDGIVFKSLYPTQLQPDIVIGDLDSANPIILKYAESLGVQIHKIACVETTDFQKALNFLKKYQNDVTTILHPLNLTYVRTSIHQHSPQELIPNTNEQLSSQKQQLSIDVCLCYNSFGGRFDQYMSIISTLYLYFDSFRIILLGDQNIVELIRPLTLLNLDHLQPISQPSQHITTQLDLPTTTNEDLTTNINSSSITITKDSTKPFQINSHKVYAGILPFLGITKCAWGGFEWDLGNEQHNYQLLQYIIQNYISKQVCSHQSTVYCSIDINIEEDVKLNELHQNVMNNAVESGFDSLLSTNNWLNPCQIESNVAQYHGKNIAFFMNEKPVVLSLSFHD